MGRKYKRKDNWQQEDKVMHSMYWARTRDGRIGESTDKNIVLTGEKMTITEGNIDITGVNMDVTEENMTATGWNMTITEENMAVTEMNMCKTEEDMSCAEKIWLC